MRITITFLLAFLATGYVLSGCAGSKGTSATTDFGRRIEKVELDEKERIKVETLFVDAAKAKILEEYEKAISLYQQVLRIDPTNDAARYELAGIYFQSNLIELAIENAREAVRLNPDNKWYKMLLAEVLSYDNQNKEAAEIYGQIVEANPDDIDTYFDYAFMLIKAEELEKALEVYNKLENMVGIDESITLQKQRIYIRMGNINAAAEEIEKLIATDPKEPRYYNMLADLYEANAMKDKAVKTYERLLKIDPNNPYALLALADLSRGKGNRQEYLNNLKKAFQNTELNIDAKISILFPYLELMHQDTSRKEEAFMLAEVLVESHPDEAKAHAMYGDLLYQDGQSQAALEQYEEAIKLDESVFTVWQQLFFIKSELQDYEGLRNTTEKAMELFPNQPLVYFFNGVANNQLENYDRAVTVLNQGVMMTGDNKALKAQFYANLGDAYHNLEKHEQSDSAYAQSLKYDPENAYVLNNYSYYLSLRNGNLEEAEKMAIKANELVPDNSAFQDTYGWILYKAGKYGKAKEWIEKSMNNGGSERPVIVEHYGDVLYKLGREDEAVEQWKKARELGSDSEVLNKKISDGKLYE